MLAVKFYVYSIYAGRLNVMFSKEHNPFKVSGVRIVLSLALTGINTWLFMHAPENVIMTPLPFVIAVVFAAVGWYVVLRIFYVEENSAQMRKALAIGTLISAVMAGIMSFISFIWVLSTVNFC